MKMRFSLGILLLLVCINLVSSAHYYVEVYETMGVRSGDDPPDPIINVSENTTIYYLVIKENIKISPNIIVYEPIQNLSVQILDLMKLIGDLNTDEDNDSNITRDWDINWKAFIIWTIVIIVLTVLLIFAYYFYQLYF